MKTIVILLFIIFISIQPSYAYWANTVNDSNIEVQGQVSIGTWQLILPFDSETEYEEGDQFIYDGEVWTVVDIDEPVGDEQTRILVIIPGEGLVLVAITNGGDGSTIVVRVDN